MYWSKDSSGSCFFAAAEAGGQCHTFGSPTSEYQLISAWYWIGKGQYFMPKSASAKYRSWPNYDHIFSGRKLLPFFRVPGAAGTIGLDRPQLGLEQSNFAQIQNWTRPSGVANPPCAANPYGATWFQTKNFFFSGVRNSVSYAKCWVLLFLICALK